MEIVRVLTEFLISNFRRVLNIVCILLGISPASDCDLPTFRNPKEYIQSNRVVRTSTSDFIG
jgi:hypothetical protein